MHLAPGMIVWATVADRNGHLKDRPVVILAMPPDPALPIVCCACSTKAIKPRPATYVRLPWDARGKSMTGLKEPCFAVANWGVTIMQADVRRISGRLSPSLFASLVKRIEPSN